MSRKEVSTSGSTDRVRLCTNSSIKLYWCCLGMITIQHLNLLLEKTMLILFT